MISRQLQVILQEHISQFPAVALLGPRQVGKTTLAKLLVTDIKSIYLDLEQPSDRAKLNDPAFYLTRHEDKLVVLDEVQRMPELFQSLRGLIDQGREKGLRCGRFLLLGSASMDLLQQSSESLAGRIAYLELNPFSVLEVGKQNLDQLWMRGGFPDSYLATGENQSLLWRENFIRTYIERDIPTLGPRIPAETLRRLWIMLAHRQGMLLNAAELARSLAVDGKTISRYLDLFVDLLLLRRLQPWHSNVGKRLVKSPKLYLRDSGLMHSLLRIANQEELFGHPILGASWEGFVIENILSVVPASVSSGFYRTAAGAEIDLLLRFSATELWGIEIKYGSSVKLEKGFYNARSDLNLTRSFAVYAGNERFPIDKETEAISLNGLLSEIREFAGRDLSDRQRS